MGCSPLPKGIQITKNRLFIGIVIPLIKTVNIFSKLSVSYFSESHIFGILLQYIICLSMHPDFSIMQP